MLHTERQKGICNQDHETEGTTGGIYKANEDHCKYILYFIFMANFKLVNFAINLKSPTYTKRAPQPLFTSTRHKTTNAGSKKYSFPCAHFSLSIQLSRKFCSADKLISSLPGVAAARNVSNKETCPSLGQISTN